jgi:hypothetical protein
MATCRFPTRSARLPSLTTGRCGQRLAVSVPDLMDYGQIKAPATEILMRAAEGWAAETGWTTAPQPI